MKFQVGDRVFVHSHCYFEDNYNAEGDGFRYSNSKNVTYICNEMLELCDKVVTITEVRERKNYYSCYKIKEDDGEWDWDDWMFEDMNNNTNTISNPNIVEDFAKLIGVKLDEEFYDTNGGFRYKFTVDSGLMVYDDTVEDWRIAFAYSLTTFFKMIKEGNFTKKWTPKDSDTVYFPSFQCSDLYDYKTYYSDDEYDKEMLKNGLYFKTKEEAVECAKKIIKKMKEG